jgi:hypothetical protein
MDTRTVRPESGLLPLRILEVGANAHRDRWEFWATVRMKSKGSYSPRLEVLRSAGESEALSRLQGWLVSVVALAPETSELVSGMLLGL